MLLKTLAILIFINTFFLIYSDNNIGKAIMLLSAYQQGKIAFGGIDREIALGHEIRDLYLNNLKILNDPKAHEWVKHIFDKVVANTKRKKISYEFFLINNKEVNAFAIPGGSIFIFSGLLKFVSSDDELAGVIGHELTHIEKKHALKLMRDNAILAPLISLGVGNIDKSKASLMLKFSSLQYQRDMELEADQGGIELSSKAGFNPKATETFLYKLSSKESVQLNNLQRLLRTHPVTGIRIQQATWKIDEISDISNSPMILSYSINPNKKKNIILNSSFEKWNKNKLENWQINCDNIKITSKKKYSGLYSIKCLSKNGIIRIVSNTIKILKITDIYSSIFSYNNNSKVVAALECYSNKKISLKYINKRAVLSKNKTNWKKYYVKFNKNDIPKKTKYIKLIFSFLSFKPIYLDNFTAKVNIKKMGLNNNIIKNNSFEIDNNNDLIPDNWETKNCKLVSNTSIDGYLSLKLGVHKDRYSYLKTNKYKFSGGKRYLITFFGKTDNSENTLLISSTFYNNKGHQMFIPGTYNNKIKIYKYWFKNGFFLDFTNISSNLNFLCQLKFKLLSNSSYIDNIKIIESIPDYKQRSKNINFNIWNNYKGKILKK